jgi:hypothetical protein
MWFKGRVIFWQYVRRLDTRVVWQFILSLTGVRKFHIEILNSSSWMVDWKWTRKSVERNSTQQSLVCLDPWQWSNQVVACELWVVGRETFLVKCGRSMVCVCVCVCARARVCVFFFLTLPCPGTTPQILQKIQVKWI